MTRASRKVTVNFDGDVLGLRRAAAAANLILSRVGHLSLNVTKLLAGLSVASLIAPTIVSLATAVRQLVGAALIAPAALLSLGAAFGVFAIAISRFGEAVSAATPEDFVTATRHMPPAMRAAVNATRTARRSFRDLRREVQEQFWTGFSDDLVALTDRYLPVLSVGMALVARQFAYLRAAIAEVLLRPAVVSAVARILERTAGALATLRVPVALFLATLIRLGAIGSTVLPRFGQWMERIALRFDAWVTAGEASGRITDIIESSILAWNELFAVGVNVWRIFRLFFTGMSGPVAERPLAWMADMTAKWGDFLEKVEVQEGLREFQRILAAIGSETFPVLGAALITAVRLFIALGPALIALAQIFNFLGLAILGFVNLVIPPLSQFINMVMGFLAGLGAGGGGGGIGGFFTNLFAGIGSMFGRQSGGQVMAGRSYLVGENGPEVLSMGRNGSIDPRDPGGGAPMVQVIVKIGETELREIVASEIRNEVRDVARSVYSGLGVAY